MPLRILLSTALLSAAGLAAADPRPPLEGVTSVRIANYGAPSVLLDKRADIDGVVSDLNGMRKRSWQRGDSKLACYSTLVVFKGKRTAALYRIGADTIVERSQEKGESSYHLAVPLGEMPRIAKLLTEIPLATRCN